MVESAKTGRGGFSAEFQHSALRLNNTCGYLQTRPSSTYVITRANLQSPPLSGTLQSRSSNNIAVTECQIRYGISELDMRERLPIEWQLADSLPPMLST